MAPVSWKTGDCTAASAEEITAEFDAVTDGIHWARVRLRKMKKRRRQEGDLWQMLGMQGSGAFGSYQQQLAQQQQLMGQQLAHQNWSQQEKMRWSQQQQFSSEPLGLSQLLGGGIGDLGGFMPTPRIFGSDFRAKRKPREPAEFLCEAIARPFWEFIRWLTRSLRYET